LIAQLQAEVAQLRGQLGQNSRKFVEAAVVRLAIRQPRAEIVAPTKTPTSRSTDTEGDHQSHCPVRWRRIVAGVANLFLHYAFDKFLEREFPTVEFERYADDGVPRTLKGVPV
jgi:hypothetical protein